MTIYRISFYDVYDDEALEKGYREDLVLKKGNHYFRLYFYDSTRFKQDMDSDIDQYKYYVLPVNTIILPKITKEEIAKFCTENFKDNYYLSHFNEYDYENDNLRIAMNEQEEDFLKTLGLPNVISKKELTLYLDI